MATKQASRGDGSTAHKGSGMDTFLRPNAQRPIDRFLIALQPILPKHQVGRYCALCPSPAHCLFGPPLSPVMPVYFTNDHANLIDSSADRRALIGFSRFHPLGCFPSSHLNNRVNRSIQYMPTPDQSGWMDRPIDSLHTYSTPDRCVTSGRSMDRSFSMIDAQADKRSSHRS